MARTENALPQISFIIGLNEEEGSDIVYQLLDSIRALNDNITNEVVVVSLKNEPREMLFQERYPWVQLIQADTAISGGNFRNIATKHAKGQFLVFLEDHVIVHMDYLKNLVSAFNKGYDIVGGSVANGNPEKLSSWVQYFCEYHKWLPGLKEGERDDLPGSNFACTKYALSELGSFSEERYKLESHFFLKAKRCGFKLYFSPAIQTSHFNERRAMRFAGKRFRYGRLFAARRGFALSKRLLYILLSPLIAILEYLRIFNHARCKRTYLTKFIFSTPQLLPTLFIWTAGECLGYLFGDNAA